MNLLSPLALLGLIPALGGILALYMLRMKRTRRRVPANFLWPERTEEIRANSPWQRLRATPLLLLQLLAMALAIFVLARPQTTHKGLLGDATILVLDASASMKATDVSPSRFEEARNAVRDALRSARPGERVALIEAGASPKVIFPLTAEPGAMVGRLSDVHATDAEGDMGEALRLASAVGRDLGGRTRIVVFSDGCFAPVKDLPSGGELLFRRFGSRGENLAVSALGVAPDAKGLRVFCSVRNYGERSHPARLVLYADGEPFDVRTADAPPGKTWGETSAAPAGARVIEARLDAKDDLAADDVAYALNDPAAHARVLLIGAGDPFLERALALDPRVTLDRAKTVPNGASYDIVVFDGVPESPTNARGVLLFASGVNGGIGDVRASASPLLEGVELGLVRTRKRAKLEDGDDAIASDADGPLVKASAQGAKRRIEVAFAPMESDFPLLPGFPIFVANSLDYLLGGSRSKTILATPGRAFALPAAAPFTLVGHDGSRTITPDAGLATVRSLDVVGPYQIQGPEPAAVYAAMRSETESHTLPADRLPVLARNVPAQGTATSRADLWRPFALAALLILAVEWLVFVRKS